MALKKLETITEYTNIIKLANQQAPKPRQIIARFLRYPDRERVMSNARKLKGKKLGISADLPKEIVDRRNKVLSNFFAAKKAGSRLILVGLNPINCLLMAQTTCMSSLFFSLFPL